MMKLFKPGGAISVFLVIILVPCLVITFLFVDISRVELSRAVAVSSADMVLNSLMTNYDKELNEYYGLVASCQNIDEFYDTTEKYFTATLTAAGLDEDLTAELVTYITQSGKNAGDLLQVRALEDVEITAVENSGLGESAVLIKEGIVEFMKYRGPVLLVGSIIEMLQDNGGDELSDTLTETKENSSLADAKDEFSHTEGELSKAEFYTFYYYDKYKKLEPTTQKLTDIQEDVVDYRTSYQEITKYAVESLWISGAGSIQKPYMEIYCTENTNTGIRTWSRTSGSKSYNKTNPDVYSSTSGSGDAIVYEVTWEDISTQIEEVDEKKNDLADVINEACTAAQPYANMNVGSADGQINEAQWYAFVYSAISGYLDSIKTEAGELADAIIKLKAMNDCTVVGTDTTQLPSNYQSLIDACFDRDEDYFNANLRYYSSNNDYLTVLDDMVRLYNNGILDRYSSDKVIVSNTGKSVHTTLSTIQSELSASREMLQGYVDALNVVIDGDYIVADVDSNQVQGLDAVAVLANKYKIDYDAWNAEANASTTTLGETNRKEINDDYKDKKDITKEDVNAFKSKLENVRSEYQGMINNIDAILWGSTAIKNISSYNTFSTEFNTKFNQPGTPMTNGEISTQAENIFKELFQPDTSGELIDLPNLTKSDYKLILSRGDDTFYDYLLDKDYSTEEDLDSLESEVDSQSSKLDGWEQQAKDAEANADKEGNDIELGEDLEANTQGAFGLGDVVTSFGSIVEALISLNGQSMRDTLYVTLYAENMFSYRTYVYEGKYNNLLSEKEKDGLTVSNYSETYKKYDEDWKETDPKTVYNKTLTNQLINADNNYANNAELEYILYGEGSNKTNLGYAYRDIYLIRFALNIASGFQNFYSASTDTGKAITSVASAISSATAGIVPQPLVKCILIGFLAALESVNDMTRLNAGMPVEVYKIDEDYWVYSLAQKEGAEDDIDLSDGSKSVAKSDLSLQYSDYLFIFLFCGFQNQNEGMYQRLGNVIEANVGKRTGKEDYNLEKAKTMFTLSGTMEVSPLMMDTSLASDYNEGLLDSLNWKQYEIKITRGY